mmetsp:Transcript_70548/g.160158  ORF Transcript_70548/g.160158 Transcript_70548/m.160158 type:complete len:200 (-) Transcript_70548:137-736(-)
MVEASHLLRREVANDKLVAPNAEVYVPLLQGHGLDGPAVRHHVANARTVGDVEVTGVHRKLAPGPVGHSRDRSELAGPAAAGRQRQRHAAQRVRKGRQVAHHVRAVDVLTQHPHLDLRRGNGWQTRDGVLDEATPRPDATEGQRRGRLLEGLLRAQLLRYYRSRGATAGHRRRDEAGTCYHHACGEEHHPGQSQLPPAC